MAAATTTEVRPREPAVVVDIPGSDGKVPVKRRPQPWHLLHLPSLLERFVGREGARRVMHGAKVGVALVLVSLLYVVDAVHDRFGDNVMWAVMTVVVIFEPSSGATICKAVNRVMGTVGGGGLGFLVVYMGGCFDGRGKAVVIATFLFVVATAATYARQLTRVKRRYDYGVMIFLLTFSLVAVSGARSGQVAAVAGDRLVSIAMGCAACILTGLLVFPAWAGDELHRSLVSKFNSLAPLAEETVQEYFMPVDGKGRAACTTSKSCMSVLYSKSADEALANLAKWEPWHGRFGFRYPWNKHLETGAQLHQLAISILALKSCLRSNSQLQPNTATAAREQCVAASRLITSTLKQLGAHLQERKVCQAKDTLAENLQQMRRELDSPMLLSELDNSADRSEPTENGHRPIKYFAFTLVDIIERVLIIVKKVEEFETVAGLSTR